MSEEQDKTVVLPEPTGKGFERPVADGTVSDQDWFDNHMEETTGDIEDAGGTVASEESGGDATDETTPAAPKRGTDGRFKKKETTEESEPEAKDTEPLQEDSEPEVIEKVDSEQLEKAMRALRRARTPQSVLDKMTLGEKIDQGILLFEDQAKADGFGTQLTTLKEQIEILKSVKPDSEPVTEVADIEPDAEAKFKEIEDGFGAELAGQMRDQHRQTILQKQENQKLQTKLKDMGDAIKFVFDQQKESAGANARTRLTETYPGISDADTYKEVQTQANSFFKTGDWPTFEQAFEDAAFLVLGREKSDQSRIDATKLNRKKLNGVANITSKPGSPKSPTTREELEFEQFNAIEDGNTKRRAELRKISQDMKDS